MSKPRKNAPRTTTQLLRDLKAGKIVGKGVPMESRRECVQWLSLEGLSNAEIADLFDMCEKTIQRDLVVLRKRNAIHPSSQIIAEMLGEFHLQVQASVKRLRRVGRDSRTSPSDQIAAERAIAESLNNLIKRLHSVGLTNGMESIQDEPANLAELLHAVTVIGTELGEDSEMGIQVIALLESIRGSIDKGNAA
jgi:DNA-binding transcriptional regulator LsrR (DeoR family)